MQISGSEHAPRAHTEALPSQRSDGLSQRPLTATQRSGGLSLAELGKRVGNFVGLRQRSEAPSQPGTAGPSQSAATRGLGETSGRAGERRAAASGTEASPSSGIALSTLDRVGGRRFDNDAVNRVVAEPPTREGADLERRLADGVPEPTLAELFAHSRRFPGRSWSDASDSSSSTPSAFSPDNMDQPLLRRTAGGRLDSAAIDRAMTPRPASEQTPAGRLSDVSSLSAHASESSPPRLSSSDSDGSLDAALSPSASHRRNTSTEAQEGSRSSVNSSSDDQPSIGRALARRYQGIDVDRIMAYNPARQATSSLEMELNGKGQLKIGENTPAALRQLLQHTLGQPHRTYLAHHGQPDGDQLLMDRQGNLLHLQQTPAAIVVLRSSRPSEAKQILDAAAGGRASGYTLDRRNDTLLVATRGAEPQTRSDQNVGGRAHLAQLTGIHEDHAGQRLRVHDGQLYSFDTELQAWTPHPDDDGVPFKQLALQADGRLYALHDDALVDMSLDEPRAPIEARGVRSFSVAADGTAALLHGQGNEQRIRLVGNGADIELPLQLDGGNAEATQVGLTRDHLYVTDNEGRLYRGERHERGISLVLAPDGVQGGERLGKTHFAEGFMQDDQARLNLLSKDPQGHLHSQPIKRDEQPVQGGWNLSDALVIDNRRGLPEVNPAPANRLNLGRLGHIALEDGQLHRWDTVANTWASTGIKNLENLQLGLDGKPYVLQGGKLLKLNATLSVGRFAHNGNQGLAPIGQNIKVALGGAVAGPAGGVRAFAMVNHQLFVTLDREGQLNLFDNGKAARPLSLMGLEGEIRSLTLDKQQNLHALTENGTLYRLPRKDWQASQAEQREASWELVATPNDRPVASARTGHGNALLIGLQGAEDEELQHDGTRWQPHSPAPLAPPQALKDLFERVRDDNRTWKLAGHTIKSTATRVGRAGVENRHRSSAAEFVRAHVFKPTLETPRPLKNLGYNLQHRWQGREGLSNLYKEESVVLTKLQAIGRDGAMPPAEGEDLKSRIARLAQDERSQPLAQALEDFRTQLEKSITQTLIDLGKEKGLLNLHGEPRADFKPPLLGSLKQKLNPYNSGEDLNRQLRDALAQLGSQPQRSAELLGLFEEKGVALSPQKSEVPLGRRRDPSDDSALLKARLALDVTTLHELSNLTEQAATIPDAPSLEHCSLALSQLRDHRYADSPLKVVTDMGFRGHDSLEADYDAVKAFLNAFKKTDHAVHINLRGAFGGDSVDMAKGLKAALKEIEGYHELHIHRSYGGRLSTPTTGPGGIVTYPSGSLGANRGYTLTFQMEDDKFTKEERFLVSFARRGGGSASVGFGIRERRLNHAHGLDADREASLGLPLDASLRAGISGSTQDALTFMLAPGEIDAFVDNLVEGNLDPYELMRRGVEHEVQRGHRFNVYLDASFSANLGYGFDLPERGSPLGGILRLQGGAEVTLNLLNYSQHHLANNGAFQREEGSLNRPRLFNQVRAALHLPQAHLIGSHTAADGTFEQARGGLDNSVSASMEMRTAKRYKFLFKPLEPVTEAEVSKASATLAKAFRDKGTSTALGELAKEHDLGRRLERMGERFAGREPENDEQYAALRTLRALADKHVATLAGHSSLGEAYFDTTYTNLHRLDQMSLLTRLSAGLNPHHVQSNSEYIAGLMAQDPKLDRLIKQLQDTPGTSARVRLELKDEVKSEIERGNRDGTLTEASLIAKLQERANLRLKAIFLFQAADKREGFTSPLPLVGYNSETSLNLVRCLGRVIFDFGRDQDRPKGYTLDGDIAQYDEPTREGIAAMKRDGFDLRRT